MHGFGKFGLVMFAAGFVLFAMNRPWPESPPPRSTEIKSQGVGLPDPGPTMGYLDTRDHRITLHGSGVYTIATKDGRVLAEKVTLKQLQASNPQLHGILQRAVAKGRNNDARAFPQHPRGFGLSRPDSMVIYQHDR